MDWWVVAVTVVVGGVALVWAVTADRRRARLRAEAASAPPQRRIPSLDERAPTPTYVSEEQALARPEPAAADPDAELIARACSAATALSGGWADEAFVTDPGRGWAVVRNPMVLACSGIGSFRELLPAVMAAQGSGRALVVVAPAVEPQAARTLAANAAQGHLPGVVVRCAGMADVGRIAAAVGAVVVSRDDLHSGWLPASSLGRCAIWVSGRDRSWAIDSLALDPST